MFKKKIERIQKARHLSQGELADFLEISRTQFNAWMKSRRNPSLATLRKITKKLNLPVEYFFSNTDNHGIIGNKNKNNTINNSTIRGRDYAKALDVFQKYISKLEEENAFLRGQNAELKAKNKKTKGE